MRKKQEVLNTVKIRKLQRLGHIPYNELMHTLTENPLKKGKWNRGADRRRISWFKTLRT